MVRAAPAPVLPQGFDGFGRDALSFLAQLAENNDRAWFAAHRETYERHVQAPLAALVSALAFAFQAHGVALTGDPKRSPFRIHRDVRFSKNKAPYKTNASLVMSRDGSKHGVGILYVQVGPGSAFMAQGFYQPEPPDLAALRAAIVRAPQAWQTLQAALRAGKLEVARDDTLVRLPRGYEQHAGTPLADVLRLKSFVTTRALSERQVFSPALVDAVLAFAQDGAPLLAFGRQAIDRGRAEGKEAVLF